MDDDKQSIPESVDQTVERTDAKAHDSETREKGSARDDAPAADGSRLRPGQMIGRYRIVQQLGRGGFGTVYLANDDSLDRAVAIKVVRRAASPRSDSWQTRLEEARLAARFEHPSVTPIYDVGETDDGIVYIVSKYIPGQTLQERLRTEKLTPATAVQYACDVASALAAIHQHGMTHRDVKPSNIIIDDHGKAVLVDFGLAVTDDARSLQADSAGTPNYMSPEQISGNLGDLDGRSDIFSLGVTLYEMLTGSRPFGGKTSTEVLTQIKTVDPRPLRQLNPAISAELERVVLRCLSKDRYARYTTAGELQQALTATVAPDRPDADKPAAERSRQPMIIGGALILSLAVVIIFVVVLVRNNDTAPVANDGNQTKTLSEDVTRITQDLRKLRDELADKDFENRIGPAVPAHADTSEPKEPAASTDDPPATADLVLPAGFEEVERKIRKARQDQDEEAEFDALLAATNDLIGQQQYRIAERAARRMVEVGGNSPSRKPIAHGQLGLALYRLGKIDEAISNYEIAGKDYQELYDAMMKLPDNPKVEGFLSQMARMLGINTMRIGNAYAYSRRYALAEASYERAVELCDKHDRASEFVTVLLNYGSLESKRGNHDKAIDILQRGLKMARKAKGTPEEEAELLINLGNALSRADRSGEAVNVFERADVLLTPAASYRTRSRLLADWAATLYEVGRQKDAMKIRGRLQAIVRPGDKEMEEMLELLQTDS